MIVLQLSGGRQSPWLMEKVRVLKTARPRCAFPIQRAVNTSWSPVTELLWPNSGLIQRSHFIVPQGSLREHFHSKQFTWPAAAWITALSIMFHFSPSTWPCGEVTIGPWHHRVGIKTAMTSQIKKITTLRQAPIQARLTSKNCMALTNSSGN